MSEFAACVCFVALLPLFLRKKKGEADYDGGSFCFTCDSELQNVEKKNSLNEYDVDSASTQGYVEDVS